MLLNFIFHMQENLASADFFNDWHYYLLFQGNLSFYQFFFLIFTLKIFELHTSINWILSFVLSLALVQVLFVSFPMMILWTMLILIHWLIIMIFRRESFHFWHDFVTSCYLYSSSFWVAFHLHLGVVWLRAFVCKVVAITTTFIAMALFAVWLQLQL